MEVEEGQRILVKTGTEYKLGDLYCDGEHDKLKITFTKTEKNFRKCNVLVNIGTRPKQDLDSGSN